MLIQQMGGKNACGKQWLVHLNRMDERLGDLGVKNYEMDMEMDFI